MDTKDWIYIFVTLVIGTLNFLYTFRIAQRRDFISTVTLERVKWIENLRQNVSKYTGKVHSYVHLKVVDERKAQDLLIDIDVLGYLIRLQLNPNEQPDDDIQRVLNSISKTASQTTLDDLKRDLETLTTLSQKVLKKEWEKVKREAHSGKL